jgi:hypothetical protein
VTPVGRGPARGVIAIAIVAIASAVALASAMSLSACRRTSVQEAPAPPVASVSTGSVAPTPVDHLAPGELVEGNQSVFGIRLPRALQIDESFGDAVVASGPVSVHALVQYLRPRLQEGGLREGEAAATFEHVKVRGQPGLELAIHIVPVEGGTRVELRDETPRTAEPLPDEPARWKQVGLTPNGRLADPTHLD